MEMQFVHMRTLRLTLDVRAQLVKWRKEKLIRRMQIIQCSIHRLVEGFILSIFARFLSRDEGFGPKKE